VQPFYIRTDVVWAEAELACLRRLLAAIATGSRELAERIADLVVFDLPLGDLYQDHWSISGSETPDDDSPDEAVYLPGRNALLALKPLLWCQTHGVSDAFFDQFGAAVATGGRGPQVRVTRPFAKLTKADVLQRAAGLPLELTFSCLSPRDDQHCGRCNKCGERRAVFAALGLADPTVYYSTQSV
jgi:7-cyano-7-deazaguanine synthase